MSRKAKILLPLMVVAVAVVVAVVLVKSAPSPPTQEPDTPPPLVRVVEVEPRTVRFDVESQGTVRPRTQATLNAQVAGRIEWVAPSFAEGGLFRRGETLVRIDARDYRLAVSQAEQQVAQAEVALAREEAEARIAREEYEDLAADGAVGEVSPLTLHEPQLAQARAAVAAAEAAVEKARLDLSRTTVQAPFYGRVEEKQADVGQSVSPGSPLATLYAVDYAEIRLPVPITDLEYLDLQLAGESDDGPVVELSAELGGSRRAWTGRVVRTAGGIDGETRMMPLVARVDEPYGAAARQAGAPLPIGLFVEARIAGRRADGVYVLPREALRETGRWREGEPGRVLVADRSEDPARLRFRDVTIVRLVEDHAVIGTGLEAGDLVCVSPLETPTDGMVVRITRDAPETPVSPIERTRRTEDLPAGGAT
jgi:RND family efflux transporter MFP subunit